MIRYRGTINFVHECYNTIASYVIDKVNTLLVGSTKTILLPLAALVLVGYHTDSHCLPE